ncbi:MAG: DUF362 domain-containing protein [Deltaproteobacteria bacterium]|nr:DUF362 domain-containing protein [Deltaproteobacteria bacterium]
MHVARVILAGAKRYERQELDVALEKVFNGLGGIQKFLPGNGKTVLLKPNFLVPKREESAVTTNPHFIAAVARMVRKHHQGPILVGDGPGLGTANLVAKKLNLHDLLEPYNVKIVDFIETLPVKGGGDFGPMDFAKPLVQADAVINLPKVKTHGQMYFTCGVKNCFGAFVGLDKSRLHLTAGRDYRTFARLLIETWKRVAPVLTIADGVTALEGNGPGNGDPRFLGLIAGSGNAMALDRVIAEILGFDPSGIPVLAEAKTMGEPFTDLPQIQVMGDPLDMFKVKDFKPAIDVSPVYNANLPGFVADFMRKYWTSRPVVNHGKCTRCGQCVKHCPATAMEIRAGRHNRSESLQIDLDACIRCFVCQEICPEGSISVAKGPLLKAFGLGESLLMKTSRRLGLH